MRARLLLPLALTSCWLACQPIVIGTPDEAQGGAAPSGAGVTSGGAIPGAGTAASSGGLAGSSAQPGVTTGGNAAEGGRPAASPDAGAPNAGANADASAGAGGENAGGVADNAGAAGSDAGSAGTGGCSLTIHGQVATAFGAPISGITVALTGQASATTTTDANGEYSLAKLCPGSYQVTPLCSASPATLILAEDTQQSFVGVPGGCDPYAVTSRVLWVIYDPTMTSEPPQRLSTTLGVDAPDRLALGLHDLLQEVTKGHVRHEVTEVKGSLDFPPMLGSFRYTAASYAACLADAKQCHVAGVDYTALDVEQGLCSAVLSSNADQIWLLGADHFGFAVSEPLVCQVLIDGEYVNKTIDVIGLNYSRGVEGVLASYQAHAQAALEQVFGAAPANAVVDAPDNPYGLFTQVQALAAGAQASGCGNLDYAPNSLKAGRFDDARQAPSYCQAFGGYPLTKPPLVSAKPTGCSAWGCNEQGYRAYWYGHLPRAAWLDAKGRRNDFWRYILHPEERLPPASTMLSCSSNYEPGWCAHVLDGRHGDCNMGEWATLRQPTGFVELSFRPERLVSGVELFDRACEEQVLSGHLEFSDGSPDQPFGALENGGNTPLGTSFEPRVLSGLRVVIDTSSGTNPGFGEINVVPAEP